MLILFIFTAILACMTARLLVYFFKTGATVLQLVAIVLMMVLTLSLLGYLQGSFNIPFLDALIIR